MLNEKGRLAIIDPVGEKAGMNYYNSCLMDAMSELGVECWIYSNYEVETESSVTYKAIFGSGRLSSLSSVFSLAVGVIKSCWYCKRNKVDTVILHQFNTNLITLYVYVWVRVFGFRVLTIAHDIESFTTDDLMFARRLIYNRFSSFVTVHNDYSLGCIKQYLTDERYRLAYIARQGHYGDYQSARLTKKAAREKLNLEKNKTYLLFFGQIKQAKGLEILLRSMNEVSEEIELIVAGRPWKTTSEEYESMVEMLEIGDRVTLMLRYIDDEERDDLFQACDIAVLPYNEIYESAVLIMSLTYGLAVVASSLPIFEDIVGRSKAGEIFPVGDSNKLATAINAVAMDKTYLMECGQRGKEWVNSNHSWVESARVHCKNLYDNNSGMLDGH